MCAVIKAKGSLLKYWSVWLIFWTDSVYTVVVRSWHTPVKNMYITTVVSSSDFYNSYFLWSNEWNTNYFVAKSFMKFGSLINSM